LTAQGNPRTIFRRAIERGSLGVAEMTADEVGRLTLGEALATAALAALGGPGHDEALAALSAMTERATRRERPRGVAS
jgi:hypothetical protein